VANLFGDGAKHPLSDRTAARGAHGEYSAVRVVLPGTVGMEVGCSLDDIVGENVAVVDVIGTPHTGIKKFEAGGPLIAVE
jgi:hypothetical protein